MNDKKLSGIERELVLQYLIDGNVPVTVTPVEKHSESEKIHSLNSQVFPIAIRPEHLKVLETGEIFLENPTQNILQFVNQDVKVEFYFNRVGLFFNSILKATNDGICLVIPEVIDRIEDVIEKKDYDFTTKIYYDFKGKKELNIDCFPSLNNELFKRPVWKSIPLENQQKAKKLLEEFVDEAKIEKNIGNGLQLIPVCNFLTLNEENKIMALENRKNPASILYVDHERIVLGFESNENNFSVGEEFGIKTSFRLEKGPITSRDIYLTTIINKVYKSNEKSCERVCIDFKYTTIQEEDVRFLYEKATSSLFI